MNYVISFFRLNVFLINMKKTFLLNNLVCTFLGFDFSLLFSTNPRKGMVAHVEGF